MENPRIRVLIVEDSPDDAYLVERVLRRSGFEPQCLRVQTDTEMRQALADNEWDIIISDYLMPEFNALGAMQICRESGRDIPFVVVSGSIGEDVAVEAMKSGVHDYLMKDNLARLPAAVDRELTQASIRRERRALSEGLSSELAQLLYLIRNKGAESLPLAEGDALLQANLKQIEDSAQRALSTIENLRDKRQGRGSD